MFHPFRASRPLTAAALCASAPFTVLAQAVPVPPASSAVAAPASAPVSQLTPVAVEAAANFTPEGRLDLDTPIDTGSRLGLTAWETPATVTVVDQGIIEARGAENTQEMLKAVPGVTAHDAPGSVGVSYRGFSGGSVTQLFNGIHVQYGIAARPVDSWIYDRLEAVGGPSSFLYGAGAVGGTINVITKLAEAREHTEARVRVGTRALREVAVGLNRRVAGDGQGAGNHYLRLDANHQRAHGRVDGMRREATQVATSLLSDFGGGLQHVLAYEYQKEDVDRPYWGTPLLQPAQGAVSIDADTRFKNYNSADGYYGQRVQWARSLTTWRVSDAFTLRNTLFFYDAQRDYRNVETYRFQDDNTRVARSGVLLQRHEQRMIGDRIDGTYRGQLAGHQSDWSFGAELSHNRQTRFPHSVSGTVNTVDPYDFTTDGFFDIPGTRPGYQPDRTNRVRTVAVYLENRTALTPNVFLVSALRHERIRLDLTNRREVTASNPARFQRDYRPTTGRLALQWQVTPQWNVYAQYATAADPASGVLSTASFADVRNNSDLTRGRQIELGTKLDFLDGAGNATLALYRITRRNITTQDPNNSALTLQVGQQSARGVELAVGWQATPRLALRGDVTYVDAQYDDFVQGGVSLAGRRPTNTPAVVANLWASYALTPELQASGGLRHVGRVAADAANTLHWPSYTLADVALAWQANRNLSVVGRVRNVTDKVYAVNVNSGQAYLGAPRTAELTLHYVF